MYSTASFTVVIFSASSSGTSMPNASSNAITNSTWSSESAPRSSTNDAVGVTSASSTPSCSTIICFTRSSTLAIPIPPRSLIALSVDLCLRFPGLLACTVRAEYSRAKIARLGPSEQPAHSIYPAPQGQLTGQLSCGENPHHRRLPKLGNPPADLDLRSLPNPRVSAETVGMPAEGTIIFPFLFFLFFFFD